MLVGEPIRILHVLGALNRGGAETMIMNIYRSIDRDVIQFDFMIHTEDECAFNEEIRQLGGRIFSTRKYKISNHALYKRDWAHFFENHDYKIVHGHMRSTAAIYLGIAKKKGAVTISHSHNTSNGTGLSAFAKQCLQYPIRWKSDYFISCSQIAGEWLFGKSMANSDRHFILKNAIELDRFVYNHEARQRVRKELGIDDDVMVIGHVGRFHEQKNHSFILEIFSAIVQKEPKSLLLFVGDGELRGFITNQIHKLGLERKVIMTGVRSDVPDLLQAMDIFLFPSKYEGLGMAIIEAQAAGLPCIISDQIPEEVHVTDLVTSISLTDDASIWRDAILTAVNPDKRTAPYKALKDAGYDIKQTAEWLQSFYKKIFINSKR